MRTRCMFFSHCDDYYTLSCSVNISEDWQEKSCSGELPYASSAPCQEPLSFSVDFRHRDDALMGQRVFCSRTTSTDAGRTQRHAHHRSVILIQLRRARAKLIPALQLSVSIQIPERDMAGQAHLRGDVLHHARGRLERPGGVERLPLRVGRQPAAAGLRRVDVARVVRFLRRGQRRDRAGSGGRRRQGSRECKDGRDGTRRTAGCGRMPNCCSEPVAGSVEFVGLPMPLMVLRVSREGS
jgi:hypothetical protein